MNDISMVIAPVSEASPCGPNVYEDQGIDGALQRLVEAAMGGAQVSAVEGERKEGGAPNGLAAWREVEAVSLETFRETKHLELAWYFFLSQGYLRGLEGLTDGLDIMSQLLSRFAVDLHPAEPDDDFNFRKRVLDRLTEKAVVLALDQVRITEGRQTGSYTFSDYRKARAGTGPDPKLIEQGFADTIKERPSYYDEILRQAAELRGALERLEKAAGYSFESYTVPLAPLKQSLSELEAAVSAFGGPLPEAGESPAADSAAGGTPGAARSADGLASREDVVRLLGRIIQFYQKFEPTSPVPIMLERAQRVATMDFKEIVREFNLSGSPSIQDVLGWKNDF
jgi:type VI secretion system protein ImpA